MDRHDPFSVIKAAASSLGCNLLKKSIPKADIVTHSSLSLRRINKKQRRSQHARQALRRHSFNAVHLTGSLVWIDMDITHIILLLSSFFWKCIMVPNPCRQLGFRVAAHWKWISRRYLWTSLCAIVWNWRDIIAAVFSGVENDTVVLNIDDLWEGGPFADPVSAVLLDQFNGTNRRNSLTMARIGTLLTLQLCTTGSSNYALQSSRMERHQVFYESISKSSTNSPKISTISPRRLVNTVGWSRYCIYGS